MITNIVLIVLFLVLIFLFLSFYGYSENKTTMELIDSHFDEIKCIIDAMDLKIKNLEEENEILRKQLADKDKKASL